MTVPKAALTYAPIDRLALGPVRAAWPVASINVGAAAMTNNWLFGRGTPIAIDGGYNWGNEDGGTITRHLRYRGQLDLNHPLTGMALCMCITPPGDLTRVGTNKLLTVTVTLPDDDGTEVIAYVSEQPRVWQWAWENTTGDGSRTFFVGFDWDGTYAGLVVNNLYIYECPTTRLPEDTGMVGIIPRQQIYDGYGGDHLSMGGLVRAVEQNRDPYFRRGVVYNWNSPNSSDPVTTSSTTYEALHPDGVKPAAQTRLMYSGETVRKCKVSCYVSAFFATSNVRVTMSNGDVATFTIAGGALGWQTPLDIDIATDDPSRWDDDGGIRSGVRDEINIEYKTGLGGELKLYALTIWDPGGD